MESRCPQTDCVGHISSSLLLFWLSVLLEVLHGWHHCPVCFILLTASMCADSHFLFPVCRLWRLKKAWVRSWSRWAFRAGRASPSRTSGLWSTSRPSSCSAPRTKRRTPTAAACCSERRDAPETTCITDTPEPGNTTPAWLLCADHRGALQEDAQKQEKKSFTDDIQRSFVSQLSYKLQCVIKPVGVRRTKDD